MQVVSDLRPDDAIASVGSHPMLAERIAAAALERRLLEVRACLYANQTACDVGMDSGKSREDDASW